MNKMEQPANSGTPTWKTWLAGARPRTLPAAVVPVVVGAGAAAGAGDGFGDAMSWWRVALALVVSLALQVGVNYANDYSDGIKGVDDVRVGPTRLVASGAASASQVRWAALWALGVAGLAGTLLAATTSWWLMLVGVAAVGAAWGYTGGPAPYGYRGLGEVSVFVFFGLVATVGTTFVAIGEIPGVTWFAAVGVGLLACALLVVNNLRDLPTDRVAGKATLAVRLGDRGTRYLYAGCMVLPFVCAAVCSGYRPWALLALAALGIARDPIRGVLAGANSASLIGVLAATGRVQLGYGILLGVGLALGSGA